MGLTAPPPDPVAMDFGLPSIANPHIAPKTSEGAASAVCNATESRKVQ